MQPSWTQDGKAILFASDRNGSFDIFRQAIGEADGVPLVAGPGDQSEPQMSPDGAWVIYKDAREAPLGGAAGTAAIERMPTAGGAPEKVFDIQGAASFRCGGLRGSPCVLCEIVRGDADFTEFDPVRGRGQEVARVKAQRLLAWDLSPDGTANAIAT